MTGTESVNTVFMNNVLNLGDMKQSSLHLQSLPAPRIANPNPIVEASSKFEGCPIQAHTKNFAISMHDRTLTVKFWS